MTTSAQKHVNPVLLWFVFMVLCPGKNLAAASEQNVIHANIANVAPSSQAKAQLHVPWRLLSERLTSIVNQRASDGSGTLTPIENRLISIPYDGEAINWNLKSGSIVSSVVVDQSQVNPEAAAISVVNGKIKIVLDELSVDQVIEKEVSGVKVRLHLNAVCGPIQMDQVATAAQAVFTLNWASGSPVTTLAKLDLSWAPGSWTFNNFTCTGPSGFDSLVRDGLAQFLREPSTLKPYVESYLSQNLQSSVDAVLAKLRTPFVAPIVAGAPTDFMTVDVGTLAPSTTGVVADLTLHTDAKVTPLPALPLPSSSVLTTLSKTEPALVGDKSVIEFLIASRLVTKPNYFRVDLQSIAAFHKLMHNRIAQLFVWQDLWHFSSHAPFYLNVTNPMKLSLTRKVGATLSSTIALSSLIQAYRDSAWWSYVVTKGTAHATVALSVKSGVLSYATTIDSLKIRSQYGAAYRKKYNKGTSSLPDGSVSKAIEGPQKDLSGTMKWPDIDLVQAGQYRASSFQWADKNTFSLGFSALN
jgi:hypothetical protein